MVGENTMSTVRREESLSISKYQTENAKVVRLLEKASTQEPSFAGREWVSGHQDNMVRVVTFRVGFHAQTIV